ncbi:iojap family protein [Perkinsela sp. CCAP 1560/4]|nr:iojap family protein [Perkinsela sp. CCAP 1560/4]|eukprot:KNH06378.1 iojap family protein [Perkinsela sp. CCAP 1560/4]
MLCRPLACVHRVRMPFWSRRQCHTATTTGPDCVLFQPIQEKPRSTPTTAFSDDDFVYEGISTTQDALYDSTVSREPLISSTEAFGRLSTKLGENDDRPIVEPFDHRAQFRQADTQELSSVPSVSLPFDDAKKAEDVIEMGIEGQIAHNWQDTRTAHAEDIEPLVACLKRHKAWDIAVVDAKQKTYAFDYLIFASCRGTRHINLVSWAIQEIDRNVNISKIKRRLNETEWEPIPVGRIIVNLMTEKYRRKANFERKWALTSSMNPLDFCHHAVSEGRGISSHGLWSLTLNIQDLEDYENDYCRETLLRQY